MASYDVTRLSANNISSKRGHLVRRDLDLDGDKHDHRAENQNIEAEHYSCAMRAENQSFFAHHELAARLGVEGPMTHMTLPPLIGLYARA
jgi:hypothetical protein